TPVSVAGDVTMLASGAQTVAKIQGQAVSNAAPGNANFFAYNASGSVWTPVAVTGDGSISASGALSITKVQGNTFKSGTPGNGQVLTWNTSGTQWEWQTSSGGSVTQVIAGTGLVNNTVTNVGTLNVDVGTTANKILQLDTNAQIPAVDGALLTNVSA